MWTYLANWLVQDGEVPELHLGVRLRQAAIRASCWTIADSEQAEGVQELNTHTAEADLPDRYTVTGIVEKAKEPNSVLLRVGSTHLFAEPSTFRSVGDDGAVEAYSPAFRVPKPGGKASIECRLEVMASHEALDLVWGLGYPDIRRDWEVEAIKIVHRAWVPVGRKDVQGPGEVLSVDDIDRIHRWTDEPPDAQAEYLLDLRPAS